MKYRTTKAAYLPCEDRFIRTASYPISDIAIYLGRSYWSVVGRIVKLMSLGMKVTPKLRKEHKRGTPYKRRKKQLRKVA